MNFNLRTQYFQKSTLTTILIYIVNLVTYKVTYPTLNTSASVPDQNLRFGVVSLDKEVYIFIVKLHCFNCYEPNVLLELNQ